MDLCRNGAAPLANYEVGGSPRQSPSETVAWGWYCTGAAKFLAGSRQSPLLHLWFCFRHHNFGIHMISPRCAGFTLVAQQRSFVIRFASAMCSLRLANRFARLGVRLRHYRFRTEHDSG